MSRALCSVCKQEYDTRQLSNCLNCGDYICYQCSEQSNGCCDSCNNGNSETYL